MKKIILILMLGLANQTNYSQTTDVNIKFSQPNPIGDAMNQVQQNINTNRIARANEAEAQASRNAVYNEAMKDNYSKVTIDELINNTNNYDYVVLESVSGYYEMENKYEILETFKAVKKYKFIDMSIDYKSSGRRIENKKKLPEELINNPKVLFINWFREAQGDVNRITKLTVNNFEGKLIYESTSKNLSYQEILYPVTSNYVYTKEQALSRIGDLKKYLDLGVITKEEYDLKVVELKPILLGNN